MNLVLLSARQIAFFVFAALFWFVSVGHADQNWDWPTNWLVFGPVPPSENMRGGNAPTDADLLPGDCFKQIPEELIIAENSYKAQPLRFPGGIIDLGEYFGQKSRRPTAYLMTAICVETEQSVRLHAGADWWMQWWLNGKPVLGTIPAGNKVGPIAVSNHTCKLELHPGTNILAVAVIGGNSWVLAAGGPRELHIKMPQPSEFQMAFARAGKKSTSAAAREAYQSAAALAKSDYEKAKALLAEGQIWMADIRGMDTRGIRDFFDRVLALKGILPQQRAEAWQGKAETYLLEQNYPAAAEACVAACDASEDPKSRARTQMVLAKGVLQKRDYVRAHEELTRLLNMEGLDLLDAGGPLQSRFEIEALRDVLQYLPLMRAEHPRLFFTSKTWPAIRERALTVEKARFEKIKAEIDALPLENIPANLDHQIMEAAFVYLVTGDAAILEKVRRILHVTADALPRLDALGGIQTYAVPRVSWAAALDWVWSDLPPSERSALVDAMILYAWEAYGNTRKAGKLAVWPHYYSRSAFFYIGLAVLNAELDDIGYFRALSILAVGLKNHRDRFDYLVKVSGEDGVWQTNVEYDFSSVPGPVFTFMHAWQPAFGLDLPDNWAHVGLNPEFILRMVPAFEYGQFLHLNYAGHSGGTWGFGKRASGLMHSWMGHYRHFFGRAHPQSAAMAGELRRRIRAAGLTEKTDYPVLDFFLTEMENAPEPCVPTNLPTGRYYKGNGLVVMSSGFGTNDTYALFSAGEGGGSPTRRHDFDAMHFSIYRNGYLAVDSGVRFAFEHSANYRHQTVAHNAVLIRMDGEQFSSVSGPVISNSGGQNRHPHEARNLAFSTSALYVYAALDAAPVYHPDKCAQMLRQFFYFPPNHFVVFDRVRARKADYPKIWLLHTANKPQLVGGNEFYADQGGGRIFCRTLLPENAVLEIIGGPGKEFWADGRNWPIVDAYRDSNNKARPQSQGTGDWWKRYGLGHTEPTEAMGRWRVEVKPDAAREEDYFLHLLEVADNTVTNMAESRIAATPSGVQLSFTAGRLNYTIDLNSSGAVGGHLRIHESGKMLLDEPLADKMTH